MTPDQYVLALDGGGIRGVYSAAVLAHLDSVLGGRLLQNVGLIAGTSTGSLIALGLGLGKTPAEILDLYLESGPKIFGSKRSLVGRIFRPAHDNTALTSILRGFFGDARMNDLKTPVAIPTFDASTGEPRVIKDDHSPKLTWGGSLLVREVALASAAAPTFLPASRIDLAGAYLDGGLWANNPSLVAVLEAKAFLGAELASVRLLSIGTGRRKTWLTYDAIARRGLAQWAPGIVDLVLDAQSRAVENQIGVLLDPSRYVRINDQLPEPIGLDDVAAIGKLRDAGIGAALSSQRAVKTLLRVADQ